MSGTTPFDACKHEQCKRSTTRGATAARIARRLLPAHHVPAGPPSHPLHPPAAATAQPWSPFAGLRLAADGEGGHARAFPAARCPHRPPPAAGPIRREAPWLGSQQQSGDGAGANLAGCAAHRRHRGGRSSASACGNAATVRAAASWAARPASGSAGAEHRALRLQSIGRGPAARCKLAGGGV